MALPSSILQRGLRAAQPAALSGLAFTDTTLLALVAVQSAYAVTTYFGAQFVAVFAMSLAGIYTGWAMSAPLVLLVCHGFKVGRIHAGAITAQMVNLHPYWNGAMRQFIRDSMRLDRRTLSAGEMDAAISAGKLPSDPVPAISWSALLHLRPEAFFNRCAVTVGIAAYAAGTLARAMLLGRWEWNLETCLTGGARSFDGHATRITRVS